MPKLSEYIGDGVYAVEDDFGVRLHANSLDHPPDKIFLEPSVLETLTRFKEKISARKEAVYKKMGGPS